jgi:tetratricopeptide (TPR) repeat protein
MAVIRASRNPDAAGFSSRSFRPFHAHVALADELNNVNLGLLNDTLTIDPNNVWALGHRASTYHMLKKWRLAISDYDKALALDPKNVAALNDRAEAKLQIGDAYGAISDLDEVIRNQERKLQDSISYEARADAFAKTQQWDLAIRDLTSGTR